MRTDIINILFCLLLGMTVVSCSFIGEEACDAEDPTALEARPVDLLVSIGDRSMKPSQAPSYTRSATTFQGMHLLVAIPYHTDNTEVAVTDDPLIDIVGADEDNNTNYVANDHSNYYVDRCYLMPGTNRMLVYGKSKPSSPYLSENGKLSDLPTKRTKTENITFSLSSIRATPEAHTDAIALASYMTKIANTPGWSTTTDPELRSYYLDFIRSNGDGSGMMSGAAANIKAFVAVLREVLTNRQTVVSGDIQDIIDKIIANIDANSSIASNNYPRSFNQGTKVNEVAKPDSLPDGAAVIRWMGNEFSVRTTTTTLDNINGINRYTYPAELVFFANSPIRTSTEEVSKATYQDMGSSTPWATFLDTHYNGSTAVNTNTKAVAVENPLQYGVGKLQVTLTGMSAPLMDAKDVAVDNADMEHLPLKGVIIGGQHTVGHNMKPRGEQTDVDGCFIYETHIKPDNSISTLVLQSYNDEKVPVILELENKTGNAFTGKDGIVYPDTRFYLIALIDPADKKEEGKDYTYRVFTQDYTTTMSMSIASLANAYTSMPDLLAPRLEVGVQVVTKWIQATTTNVEL